MYNNKKVCVILPTYNEKDSIKKCINDFEALGIIDRIIVINNNATKGTHEEVMKTSAEEFFEPIQGYGAAIQRGFKEANEDLIFVCEPDDTFLARDIYKFLAYIGDTEVVYGSRTVKTFIWNGANMGWFLRFGNWAVAKLMEMLYNTNSLSDVGCTFRLIRKDALMKMINDFRITSNFFGPEMMLLTKWKNISFLQIPVNYKDRVGESSVTGDMVRAFKLGLQMIWLILTFRFRRYSKN
ncbi:MAG: glycosyltransferase family 2 protein [Smithella sp.]